MNKGEGYWEDVARHGQPFEDLIDEVHAEIQAERKAQGLAPYDFAPRPRRRTASEVMAILEATAMPKFCVGGCGQQPRKGSRYAYGHKHGCPAKAMAAGGAR